METLPTTPSFISCFAKLKDPRKEEKINHKLSEILLIVLCGTICGANSWRDYVTDISAILLIDYLNIK